MLGDPDDGEGAVEYYDTIFGWTGICVDSFYLSDWLTNLAAASIVCRQLGYEDGTPIIQTGYTTAHHKSHYLSLSLSLRISTTVMPNRLAGRLDCDTAMDFDLNSCTAERATCDVTSSGLAGGVLCSKTGEQLMLPSCQN